jgi:hypothetical protein
VQGSIRISGHLALTGNYSIPVDAVTLQVALSDWETLTMDNQRMSGRFLVKFSASSLTGSVQFTAELGQLVKGSSALAASRPGDGSLRRAVAGLLRRR